MTQKWTEHKDGLYEMFTFYRFNKVGGIFI